MYWKYIVAIFWDQSLLLLVLDYLNTGYKEAMWFMGPVIRQRIRILHFFHVVSGFFHDRDLSVLDGAHESYE